MTMVKNYKDIRQAYESVKDNDDILKSRRYYSSLDSATGSYQDTSRLAARVMNDLQRLNMRKELCGSFEVKLKHNNHDMGSYYNLNIYSVELEVDDDSELYDIVSDYQQAGLEQLEVILKRYAV